MPASFEIFKSHHPAIVGWLEEKQLKSDFAASLLRQLRYKGDLSERQIMAVENCLRRDAEEKMRREAQAAKPALDVGKMEGLFATARARGIANPKLRLGDFYFSGAGAMSKTPGAIWVKTPDKNEFGERTYLGKILNSQFYPGRDCTSAQEVAIREVAANPSDAAKAYGQRTGMCCVCGRKLTKGESIDAMIGPICAEKFGFVF